MNAIETLKTCAKRYEEKVNQHAKLSLQFTFTDLNDAYDILIDEGRVEVLPASDTPKDLVATISLETFNAILNHEIEAFTAAGKADMQDAAPLDWRIGPTFTPDKLNAVYDFLMHFFTKEAIRVTPLKPSASRIVHGGHAIPLFYHTGMRSAWYMVKKGEQMNKPGDTNPFDQGIIVISGTGKAKIGDHTYELKAQHAYHVPKNHNHVIWTEDDDPLVMIWLAWGKGA